MFGVQSLEFEVRSLKFGVPERATTNFKLRTSNYPSKKAGKSKASVPEIRGVPEIIFLKTFFAPSFEIKSCSTFAASFLEVRGEEQGARRKTTVLYCSPLTNFSHLTFSHLTSDKWQATAHLL